MTESNYRDTAQQKGIKRLMRMLGARQKVLCKKRQATVKGIGANQGVSLAGHSSA